MKLANIINSPLSRPFSQNTNQSANVYQSDWQYCLNDIYSGLVQNWRIWLHMSLTELKRRYRRTIIGPFWTTLSLAIFISCMGLLLSSLWKQNMQDFLPFFCSGFICWTLIATIIIESCLTFVNAAGLIKQVNLPYSTYVFHLVSRNVFIFFHHLPIFIIVIWYFKVPINLNQLLAIPALLMLAFTGCWVAILLGLVCARFRDIQQVVASVLQLSMFVTPIFWKPEHMGRKGFLLADSNPLYHYVNILRSPLIGELPTMKNWLVVCAITAIGWALVAWLFSKKYKQLVFWV